jgi:hypothetical protein
LEVGWSESEKPFDEVDPRVPGDALERPLSHRARRPVHEPCAVPPGRGATRAPC